MTTLEVINQIELGKNLKENHQNRSEYFTNELYIMNISYVLYVCSSESFLDVYD